MQKYIITTESIPFCANSFCQLFQRPDHVGQLCVHLDESSKQEIAHDLPLDAQIGVLLKKVDISKSFDTISALLEHHRTLNSPGSPNSITQLSVIQNYLCNRFDTKDLIIFCSELLRKVYEKPIKR